MHGPTHHHIEIVEGLLCAVQRVAHLWWIGSNGYMMVDGIQGEDRIQRIYDGGWDPSGGSDSSKSEQATRYMDLEHFVH
jgi:hypothetical protein